MSRRFDLVITTCGYIKIGRAAPARSFYTGSFAQTQMKAARALSPSIGHCILSNKHGFMRPEHIIPGPYNSHWGYPDTMPDEKLRAMAESWQVPDGGLILCLGAYEYAWQTRKFFRDTIDVLWVNSDMPDRSIGKQRSRLIWIINNRAVPEAVYGNHVDLERRKM